jgi:hypothetical protein
VVAVCIVPPPRYRAFPLSGLEGCAALGGCTALGSTPSQGTAMPGREATRAWRQGGGGSFGAGPRGKGSRGMGVPGGSGASRSSGAKKVQDPLWRGGVRKGRKNGRAAPEPGGSRRGGAAVVAQLGRPCRGTGRPGSSWAAMLGVEAGGTSIFKLRGITKRRERVRSNTNFLAFFQVRGPCPRRRLLHECKARELVLVLYVFGVRKTPRFHAVLSNMTSIFMK